MARKKVNLGWIHNDALRRSTFKKRRRGLLKKVSELSTLCDVTACAVVYGPHDVRPEVFPNEVEARQILQRFRELPETEQSRKMMDQETFLKHRVMKLADQLDRMRRSSRELEVSVLMCSGLSSGQQRHPEDMTELAHFVDARLKAVRTRMQALDHVGRGPGDLGVQGLCMDLLGPVPPMQNEQQMVVSGSSNLGDLGSYMDLLGGPCPVPTQNEQQQMVVFGSGGQGEIMHPFVVDHNGFGGPNGLGPWMGGPMGDLPFFPTEN